MDVDAPSRRFEFDRDESARVDQFLAEKLPDVSRSQLKRWCDEGRVRVSGAVAKPAHKLRPGDVVDVEIPAPQPTRVEPQAIELSVLFEDEHLIVIDKPPGLVVHPAPGHADGTLVNALLHHCEDLSGVGGELRPGIVHRLDKDTSGVMVATKNDRAHQGLADAFRDKTLEREYLAVVAPPPQTLSGTFDTCYGRHPTSRKKFSSRVSRGKRAVTHYATEEKFDDLAALVRCRLETGRTHQIRVHFADAGTPVLGDPIYARRPKHPLLAELAEYLGRQALHAAVLRFDHPVTGERVSCESPMPADMMTVIERLRQAHAS